jgi:hypothetical protein
MKIKECDRIKTKDGRVGTVMLLLNDTGLEVEFTDTAPETETIECSEVVEIIK